MYNLNDKKFHSVENSLNGEVSGETLFFYHQEESIVWAEYSGGTIIKGSLLAVMNENENLDMKYHHINKQHQIMTGIGKSVPEIKPDGKIRFNETWKWTSGDCSHGSSIVDEF